MNVVVEDGFNTSYIDTLLVALFYTPSIYLDELLRVTPKDSRYIYLQEMIKTKFVDKLRKNLSIPSDTLNELRIYMKLFCDWKIELLSQQDITEFYRYIMVIMNAPTVNVVMEEGDSKEVLPFIDLVPPFQGEVTVKELISRWMGGKRKVSNVPNFVGVYLNRFSEGGRNNVLVDINRKIKLSHVTDSVDGLRWKIHSLICHQGDSLVTGHYYGLVAGSKDIWYIFDNRYIPSVREVNIKLPGIMERIKVDVIFAIYCYDETL